MDNDVVEIVNPFKKFQVEQLVALRDYLSALSGDHDPHGRLKQDLYEAIDHAVSELEYRLRQNSAKLRRLRD